MFKNRSASADGEWDLPGGWAVEKQEVYRILNEAYFGEDCDERELFRLIEPPYFARLRPSSISEPAWVSTPASRAR